MKTTKFILGMVAMLCLPTFAEAQSAEKIQFKGVKNHMRYDDGEDTHTVYLGWDAETGTAKFSGDQGLWTFTWDGTKVDTSLDYYENVMYGNSGAFQKDGIVYTIFSHESPNDGEDVEFVVRTFDANSGARLTERTFPKSANLESRGLCYNPKDQKVYGLFYLTDVVLPVSNDELDQEDVQEGYTSDAGYAICTLDLETMAITQITPGVYYDNFVFLACSPDGRLFSMTSGGTLCQFDATTGLMMTKTGVDEEGNAIQENIYPHSGVESQFKRQSACFDHVTGKLYWNGFINSGKGINEWGSWSTLSDKEWRTNGKYDTALYEVNIETGVATRLALIPNRMTFSCMWIPGREGYEPTGISDINATTNTQATKRIENGRLIIERDDMIFNAIGQQIK